MKTNSLRLALPLVAALLSWSSPLMAQTVSVGYDANAPTSNFGSPGTTDNTVAYSITTTSDSNNLYLAFSPDPTLGGTFMPNGDFTNLYFSTTVAHGSGGSNIGIEVQNDRAFVPGASGYYSLEGLGVTSTEDASGNISVTIPLDIFENDPEGSGATKLSTSNNILRLNLSQSYGYSVAGGKANYGPTELGEVMLAPEPTTFTLVGVGFCIFCLFAFRRRPRHEGAPMAV